jgi:hypothetical protein
MADHTSEHLRKIESSHGTANRVPSIDAPLTQDQIQEVFEVRTSMYRRVEQFINGSLQELLREKIQTEHHTLEELLKDTERAVEQKRKSIKILDTAFFLQKPIDPNIF